MSPRCHLSPHQDPPSCGVSGSCWSPTLQDRPRENRKVSGAVPEGGYCWPGSRGSGGGRRHRGHPVTPCALSHSGLAAHPPGCAPVWAGAARGCAGLPLPPHCSALEGKINKLFFFPCVTSPAQGGPSFPALEAGGFGTLALCQMKKILQKTWNFLLGRNRRFDTPGAGVGQEGWEGHGDTGDTPTPMPRAHTGSQPSWFLCWWIFHFPLTLKPLGSFGSSCQAPSAPQFPSATVGLSQGHGPGPSVPICCRDRAGVSPAWLYPLISGLPLPGAAQSVPGQQGDRQRERGHKQGGGGVVPQFPQMEGGP